MAARKLWHISLPKTNQTCDHDEPCYYYRTGNHCIVKRNISKVRRLCLFTYLYTNANFVQLFGNFRATVKALAPLHTEAAEFCISFGVFINLVNQISSCGLSVDHIVIQI